MKGTRAVPEPQAQPPQHQDQKPGHQEDMTPPQPAQPAYLGSGKIDGEVAPCYVFLASPDSSCMTGQTLHPNGGSVVNG